MKIFCFGDSNTYGFDPRSYLGDCYNAQERWVDRLAEISSWETVNAGENGRRIPRDAAECRKRFLASNADICLIMLGSNDLLQGLTAEETAQKMERFLNQLALEEKTLCLLTPPPFTAGTWVTDETLKEESGKLVRAYALLAQRLNTACIRTDTWDIPLCFDGVHFTEQGHRIFAEKLYCAILALD